MALDAAELADIQADLVSVVCDKPCVIQRATKTPDGRGSFTDSYATISPADLKVGMRQPSSGEMQNYAFRIEALAAWTIHFPIGTDVQPEDILLIESDKLTVHVLLDPHTIPGLLPVLAAELKP